MNRDPRVVGGRYYCGYWRYDYTVLAIDGVWITERMDSPMRSNLGDPSQVGTVKRHCTAWDARNDRVLALPKAVARG